MRLPNMFTAVRTWLAKLRRVDPSFWVLLSCAIALAWVADYYAKAYHYNVVDDAYISFQYTKNLVLGRGLVFNPGQFVEGYTNFLWVILLAPIYVLTRMVHGDFTRTVIACNIGLAVLDLALVYVISRRLFSRDWVASCLVLLLCVLDNSYQCYAMSGLENHLLMFWLLASVWFWTGNLRRRWLWTGLSLAAATMTRPDAALFVVCFGIAHSVDLVFRSTSASRSERAKAMLATSAVWIAVYGVYFAWRYHYYGALLPNTFYLKVGSTGDALQRGWDYTVAFVADRSYVPLLALLALRWAHRPLFVWLAMYLVVHAGYVTYVGGDFYTGHRFYVALLPLVYLLVGRVAHGLLQTIRNARPWRRIRAIRFVAVPIVGLAVGTTLVGLVQFTLRSLERGTYRWEILVWGEQVHQTVRFMKWFGTFAHPGESLVVGDIGSAGFFADVVVVDVFGVVDPEIARMEVPGFGHGKPGHEKWASREYLLATHPTYVKWGWIPGDLSQSGYYLFNDFPRGIQSEGLWVRDDLQDGAFLPETAIHFNDAELAWWSPSGDAFDSVPATRVPKSQHSVFGNVGSFVDTFTERRGDSATGRLLSPAFPLVGDLMVLRVGGGRNSENLRVSLLVDGVRAFSATGTDRETLGRRVWRIEPYKGREAALEIVDNAVGDWGHILVDEAVQWRRNEAR